MVNFGKLFFHHDGQGFIVRIGGFPGLEEDIRILGRAVSPSVLGGKTVLPETA